MKAAQGQGRRIGLLVPSSNTTVEPEFYRALPPHITVHVARLHLTQITPESILGMVADLEAQSRGLASADVDVIVLGATAPSFLKGLGYDREIARRIGQPRGSRAVGQALGRNPVPIVIPCRRIVAAGGLGGYGGGLRIKKKLLRMEGALAAAGGG